MADTPTKAVQKMLETARERYKRAMDAESENRKLALEALRFRNLEQWDLRLKKEREADPDGARPCLVVDKTNQYLRQVCNEERQNRPSVKVRPVDDKGDVKVAEIFQGIVRHIEDRSSADIAYDTAYEQAADGGFGYFRVLTEYADETSFEQDIRIKRIRNRFQVVLDPDRQEPDGSDAKWGFITESMTRDDYAATYGEKNPIDFDSDAKVYPGWVEKEHVIIAEYFRIEYENAVVCLWPDGSTSVKGAKSKAADLYGGKPVKERKTRIPRVMWSKINGKDELESRDWLGKFIPIVEVIGNELDIEGRSVKSGLIRNAMEPQKIHNYAASSFVEGVALAPRAQWVAAEGQIEGFEELYRTANRKNISVLPYKPVVADGNVPVPPPQRVAPPGIATGWQQLFLNTEHDIQASMGMYDASLGETSNERSGRAIVARQKKADTATFHYVDNLTRSIRHCGRILVDLIPKIYDTERVARILGEDGTSRPVMLNPNQDEAVVEQMGEDGAIQQIYNLNVGKYDVTVAVGPSYSTKRAEAVDWMTQVIQAQPELMQVGGDILFRNMDAPGADEWSKRLKKLLPPNLQETDGAEQPMMPTPQGPMPLPQAAEFMQGMALELAQAQEALKKAGDLEQIDHEAEKEQLRLKNAADALQRDKEIFALQKQVFGMERDQAEQDVARAMAEADSKKQEGEAIVAKGESERDNVTQVLGSVAEGLVSIGDGMSQQAQAIAQQAEGITALAEAVRAPRKNRMMLDGEMIESTSEVM